MDFFYIFGFFMIVINVYLILHFTLLNAGKFESEIRDRVKKIYTRNTYGYYNFLTKSERNILLKFILDNKDNLKIRAKDNELFGTIQEIPNYPKKLIEKLRKRIIYLEGVGKHHPDLLHEDTISFMSKGGYHDYHRDMNYVSWVLVRYNIIISKPDLGGLSVYGDEINEWPVGSIWKCVAGLVDHGVTEIKSNDDRIVLCLGFMINYPDVTEKQHNQNVKSFQPLPKDLSYMVPE